MSKERSLNDCLGDILKTAYRDGEFIYVNAEMVIEALEILTEFYHEDSTDWIYDIGQIVKGLKFDGK